MTFLTVGICLVLLAGGFVALRRFESLAGKSTEDLRAGLQQPQWTFYRNALRELRRRGESIQEEVVPVLSLLVADSYAQRYCGQLILREMYPELAARIAGYDPKDTPEVCRQKTRSLMVRAA